MTHEVYLGLGSNLGSRRKNLCIATEELREFVTIEKVSRVYESRPAYVEDQAAFLNSVLHGRTRLSPLALLRRVKEIEWDIGRRPGVRYGARIMDIDILLYDALVSESRLLTIPHPRMLERAFVLVPLAEIAPGLRHPVAGKSIHELLAEASGLVGDVLGVEN